MEQLLTEHLDIWTAAQAPKTTGGRGRGRKANGEVSPHGIKKLRELILELAVRGKLVEQDPNDEPASVLLEKIVEEKARLIKEGKIKKQKKQPEISEEEKSFDLPEGWKWSRVGGVFDLQYGKALPAKKRNESGLVDVFGSNGIVGKHTESLIEDSCIIIGRKGSAGALNKAIRPSWTTDVAYFLVPPNDFNFDYAFLFLESLRLDKLGKGIKPGVNRNEAYMLVGAIPPTAEQKRIVAKVDELMAVCDRLEQEQADSNATHQALLETLLSTLTAAANHDEFSANWQRFDNLFHTLFTTEQSIDQLKQTILQLAVMGKLIPQNPNDESVSVLLEQIAVEKAQLIADKKIKKKRSTDTIISENCNWSCPSIWSESELQDLFRFIDYRGKNPKKSEKGKRLITAKNIRMGFIKDEPVEFISDELYDHWMVRGFPQNGDILFVTEGHTMGFVTLIEVKYEFALAQRTICFQPYINLNTKFFLYALMSLQFQNIVRDNQTGSAAGGIKASKLKRIPIPVPPLAEQLRIVAKVDELMALCDTLKARLSEVQTTQIHLADAMVEQAVV